MYIKVFWITDLAFFIKAKQPNIFHVLNKYEMFTCILEWTALAKTNASSQIIPILSL